MNSNWKKIDPKHIRAGGEIRQRMVLTAEKILHHLDVEQVFVRHFRNRREHPEVPGGFVGYGMFLDAVVKAAAHGIGGEEMIQYKKRRFAELAETQSADGAITMFSGEPGRWDNHEQAYMIQAFVLDHRYFGCENSLKAALRLGNYLIQRKTSVNLGLETAFLMLTEESGDFKFASRRATLKQPLRQQVASVCEIGVYPVHFSSFPAIFPMNVYLHDFSEYPRRKSIPPPAPGE